MSFPHIVTSKSLLNIISLILLLQCFAFNSAKQRSREEKSYIKRCKEERKAQGIELDGFYLIKRGEIEDCWLNDYPCKVPEKYRDYCFPKDSPVSKQQCESKGCCFEEVGLKKRPKCYKKKEKEIKMHEFTLNNVPKDNKPLLSDEILEFPGCFDLKAQIVIRDSVYSKTWVGSEPNWLIYMNWTLLESPESFEDLTCKNQDKNGCGGQGMDCYFCDFCKESLNGDEDDANRFTCPTTAGVQTLRRQDMCFNTWGDLDKEEDGDPDFICFPEFEQYRVLIEEFGNNGYGAIRLQFIVARNDTDRFDLIKKVIPPNKFKQIYRDEMAKLVLEEQIACSFVVFDVCGERPKLSDPDQYGDRYWYCPSREEVDADKQLAG